jgi:hypothetical protein
MTGNLLSQIRIVETDRILPFEWMADEPRGGESLIDDPRYVRHPFPVLDLRNGNYLLLDNVDRFASLSSASLNHLPVQLCPRKSIRVFGERLGLIDFDYDALYRIVARHPDQILLDTPRDSAQGYIAAQLEFRDQAPTPIYFRDSSRSGCATSLDMFFRGVLQHGDYLPVIEWGEHAEALFKSASFSAFLTLPAFTLDHLETAATSDRLFPPGVISVQTDSRVFYIDFPQSVLRSDLPTREKEAFLRDLLLLREQSRRTTHYHGQIYILNR